MDHQTAPHSSNKSPSAARFYTAANSDGHYWFRVVTLLLSYKVTYFFAPPREVCEVSVFCVEGPRLRGGHKTLINYTHIRVTYNRGRFFSDDSATRYILPVLWMTSLSRTHGAYMYVHRQIALTSKLETMG